MISGLCFSSALLGPRGGCEWVAVSCTKHPTGASSEKAAASFGPAATEDAASWHQGTPSLGLSEHLR